MMIDEKRMQMKGTGPRSERETWIETGKGLFRQAPEKVLDYRRMALGLLLLSSLWPASTVSAQPGSDFVRRARIIETPLPGLPNPAGVAFSRRANTFIVLQHIEPREPPDRPGPPDADVILITHREKPAGSRRIAAAITDPINMVFDDKAHRLLFYDADPRQIIEVRAGRSGLPDRGALTRIPAPHYGIGDAQGMAVDPMTGRLFILDSERPKIVVVEPDAEGGLREATASAVRLRPFGSGELRGIAFDPTNGHFHVLGPATQRLYEITDTGLIVANRDLSGCDLRDPQGMVFAPSGDLTDDPSEMSLYIVEAGTIGTVSSGAATTVGRISELSLIPPPWPPGTTGRPRSGSCGRSPR
jgi:hypothetical protein